jgi:hypothetical protein
MAVRCVATASATVRSSAFIRSTISMADARSISTLRGLRRSVTRGSSTGGVGSERGRCARCRAVVMPSNLSPVMTPRTRSVVVALGLACVPALSPLGAQLISVPDADDARRPITVAVGAGLLQTQGRYDGQSGVSWNLGESFQYRASVEVGLRSGSLLGITGALASVPISRGGVPGSDGDIQHRLLMATFRSPEGQGFYQLIEIGAGLSQWASYSGTDALTAEERKARNGFVLSVGFGFGFALGDRGAFTLVQDAGTVIGSSEGLPSGTSRVQRQYTTRLGFRLRLGGDRSGVRRFSPQPGV